MKIKYIVAPLLFGYAGSCFAAQDVDKSIHCAEISSAPKHKEDSRMPQKESSLTEHKLEDQIKDLILKRTGLGIAKIESDAIKRAISREFMKMDSSTNEDFFEGIETYRKIIIDYPHLEGISFDIYPRGVISINDGL